MFFDVPFLLPSVLPKNLAPPLIIVKLGLLEI